MSWEIERWTGSIAGSICRQQWASLKSRLDRKSTRLNSSHSQISYAVFCLKKKNNEVHTASVHVFNATCLTANVISQSQPAVSTAITQQHTACIRVASFALDSTAVRPAIYI